MRIFSGTLATETNTFAPMPTGLQSYRERGYFPAGQHPDEMTFFAGPLWAARLRGRERGWTLVEGMVAAAQPSGITTRAAYEGLRDELLRDLRAALPVDVVLLGLHGAMVADGYDDCEGDLLERVRAIVGPGVVVGAELDLHCHLTRRMVDHADWLVAFKEYPHVDVLDRALELVDLCVAQAEGRLRRPVPALVDTGMVCMIHTTREPARGFVDRLRALEGRDGVHTISVAHGFPWGDVPDMGTRVLVYADDASRGQALAQRLADELVSLRDEFSRPNPGIDAALDQALALDGGPVVLSEGADNAGGGAASDATFVLRRLIERRVAPSAIGPLWDPVAVRIATEAGVGARLALRVGGKVSPMSGDPLDLQVEVRALAAETFQTGLGGTRQPMGDSALVHADGVDIVLTSIRGQAMGTDLFTQFGCDLRALKVVVVKSSQHFHAAYAPLARAVIYLDSPGSVTQDIRALPYRKVPRPRWPL
ncbi:MAG: M81 family metallopeptidase [Rubrivivax sp.]